MRLGIVGSRTFKDKALLYDVLNEQLDVYGVVTVVSGGAKGADTLAENWAKDHGLEVIRYLPDWNKYGKQAGFIRNSDIVKNCGVLVAFWDGKSRGTLDSITKAVKSKKLVIIQGFKNKEDYWVSCPGKGTGRVTVEDEIIVETPDIWKKFIGQSFTNLKRWLGPYEYYVMD